MNTVEELFRGFEQLNEIGSALSSERDINSLLEKILVAAKNITRADAGTVYFMDENRETLQFAILMNDSQKLMLGGTSGNAITLPPLPLKTANGEPNNAAVAAYCAIKQVTVNIPDAYEAEGFDFSGTRRYDEVSGYRSKSFLTIPMKNHENEVIGVLQLINAKEPQSNNVISFTLEAQHFAESLASQAAIALNNRQLLQQLENMFESFIGMINMAIDDKSPYTGGHCQRVPTLTMLLADAVVATNDGPFAAFDMTEADRYELKIAGLLHDCGKVTTPVHIVDKATKLETICDRIDLVDTRFEVLKRDAEISMLKASLAANNDAAVTSSLQREFDQKIIELYEERDFLRFSNIGTEAMSADDQQRVRDIATRQWVNTDGLAADFLSADEIENLTIRAGTLTHAERQIINNHIVVTIKMLESLPWAKHLKRVPEFAGGHHERMDGKGYPRGLTRDQMSVQARVMAIADIFEALTAKDRPYKVGKSLTEALHILGKFSLNGHIDPDLFDIFVRQKVYKTFVDMFVDPDQIDEVDESKIPGYVP
jgi:HD-GYP domain-containing protein (c-di-GMP phosphodiesterase class II)